MKLRYYISPETNPYHNIAVEEYLLKDTAPDECILYLWQNDNTVVIGHNQNLWNECKLEALQADGGHVARRLSGGGAVYHDMGNLNFTFLTRKEHYNVARQTEVILNAVKSFGIPAVRAGRNDLLIEGQKFSGNAFYQTGDFCYHHGTVLIRGDKTLMAKYLNPSAKKLQSKAVASVKSRVCNLTDYDASVTVEAVAQRLIDWFGEIYQGSAQPYNTARFDSAAIAQAAQKFGSWDWLYGRKIPFDAQWSRRFDWGEVQLQFAISQGMIQDLAVWTDALDATLADTIKTRLLHTKFDKDAMQAALGELGEMMEGEWDV